MDEELARIAAALERLADSQERIADAVVRGVISSSDLLPARGSVHGKGGRSTRPGRLKPAPPKASRKAKKMDSLKPCIKCGKPCVPYWGGHGLGECCRPKKGKPHFKQQEGHTDVKSKALGSSRANSRPALLSTRTAPTTTTPQFSALVPQARGPRPATARDVLNVQDMLARFVFLMRDRCVAETSILSDINRKAEKEGQVVLTDAQAQEILDNIKKSPRPGY